jgi:hypothetical protein
MQGLLRGLARRGTARSGRHGASLMKFTLTYDGELPSTGNSSRKVEKKWEVKKHFDPQLRELWAVHPALREMQYRSTWPKSGGWFVEGHHSVDTKDRKRQVKTEDDIDLLELATCEGRTFLPLVRSSLLLTCGLKILFLRKETPGKIYQGGDIDNRIKTLLDALSVPKYKESVVVSDQTVSDPIYCLLEDDSLISSLSVDTQTLLTGQDANVSQVRLIIEVDVKVSQSRAYNSLFLGD